MEKTDRLQDIQDTKSQVLKSSTLEAQYSVSAAKGDSATVLGLLMLVGSSALEKYQNHLESLFT